MGYKNADIGNIRDLRRERAQSADIALFRQLFEGEMHGTLVSNLHRCGVLNDTMRQWLEEDLRINVAEQLASD